MAPILFIAMLEEHDLYEENVAKLDTFNIFNRCADEYTRLDTARIEEDLNKAKSAIL